MSVNREVNCASCGNPIPQGDVLETPRIPCPSCGSTSRVFHDTLTELVSASARLQATVIRLSVDTSAAAVAVMTTMGSPEGMDSFWDKSAELRHQMLLNHGSDQALRAIASGAFDPAPQYPFDEPTKAIARYVAAEELHGRRDATERDRAARATTRDRRRAWMRGVDRFMTWCLGIFRS